MHWEIVLYHLYNPDLSPCYFHLFGPLKGALSGIKFEDNDEVEDFVQNCLRTQPRNFYFEGILKLSRRWQKCNCTRTHVASCTIVAKQVSFR